MPDNLVDGTTQILDIVIADWWTVDITSITYGGEEIKSSDVKYAIFDTGTSLITMPTEDFNTFAAKMQSIGFKNCNSSTCYLKEQCEEFWPDMEALEFTLAG